MKFLRGTQCCVPQVKCNSKSFLVPIAASKANNNKMLVHTLPYYARLLPMCCFRDGCQEDADQKLPREGAFRHWNKQVIQQGSIMFPKLGHQLDFVHFQYRRILPNLVISIAFTTKAVYVVRIRRRRGVSQ